MSRLDWVNVFLGASALFALGAYPAFRAGRRTMAKKLFQVAWVLMAPALVLLVLEFISRFRRGW